MKNLLVTIFVFIGMMGWAQEAKLEHYYVIDPFESDTAWYHDYIYDENNYLEKVYQGTPGDTIWVYNYSNDTLVSINWPQGDITHYLNYYADSVVRWQVLQGDTIKEMFYLNSLGQVTDFITGGQTISFTWDEDNVIQRYVDNELTASYDYSADYLNPFYEENKYLRIGNRASWKNTVLENNLGSHTYEYEVIESEGPYPLLVERFKNGVLQTERHFKYLYVLTETTEIPANSNTILKIAYFDMMGREISKPKKGFYIERKHTTQGFMTTKHFIP